jgi:segregation and condensation protein B
LTATALRGIVESLLFVADAPLSVDRLCAVLEEFPREEVRTALTDLAGDYQESGRGMVLAQVAGGYQLRSRHEHADYIRRLKRGKSVKFSPSALETLAIIAYRQPVTRAEVEYLRGVDIGGVLKNLMDKKLIRILGKKDIPGKPLIYGTTREFMEVFSLKDLASLPPLKEIQELAEAGFDREQVTLPLPLGETAGEREGL